jgi:Meiotically up-regulated gene 113
MHERVKDLQTGCPWKLTVLAVTEGTKCDEKGLHQRFRELHMRGEWFELHPVILALAVSMPTARAMIEYEPERAPGKEHPLAPVVELHR